VATDTTVPTQTANFPILSIRLPSTSSF
jgi:hypothetical protein